MYAAFKSDVVVRNDCSGRNVGVPCYTGDGVERTATIADSSVAAMTGSASPAGTTSTSATRGAFLPAVLSTRLCLFLHKSVRFMRRLLVRWTALMDKSTWHRETGVPHAVCFVGSVHREDAYSWVFSATLPAATTRDAARTHSLLPRCQWKRSPPCRHLARRLLASCLPAQAKQQTKTKQ